MKSLRNFSLYIVALALTLVPLISACSPAAAPSPTSAPAATAKGADSSKPAAKVPAGEPYLIGAVSSVSGFSAPMGASGRDAIMMLEEKVNADGGINGRPIKVVFYDDESDETKGVTAVKKLIEQDKVLGIVGTVASGVAMAEAPIIEEGKVPWVAMMSSRAILTPPKKWIFKLPISEKPQIEITYQHASEQGYKNLALLMQGAAFGKEGDKYFNDTAQQKGFKIVADESYGPNDTDMAAQLTKIKAANPDMIVVYGAEAAAAIAIGQAKAMDIKAPIIGPQPLVSASIMQVKELRDGMTGFFVVGNKYSIWQQLPDSDPQKKIIADFAALLQQKYNRPISGEGNAYDAFMLMVNAIKKANPDTTNVTLARQQVRDALESTKDYIGVGNIVSYSPDEHEIVNMSQWAISQVQPDGSIKLIKTFK